jgi:hypothetical protein
MTERRQRFAAGAALSFALVSCADAPAPQSVSASERYSVVVSSTDLDTPTKINLEPGDEVSITAVGSWTMDHRSLPLTGPGGYPPEIIVWDGNKACRVVRDQPDGALIAKVGDAIIPIGEQKTFIAPVKGPLDLGPNDIRDDQWNCRADNEEGVKEDGTEDPVTAFITVTR